MWLDYMLSKPYLKALVSFYSKWKEMEPGALGCLPLLRRPVSLSQMISSQDHLPEQIAQKLSPEVQIVDNIVGKAHSSSQAVSSLTPATLGSFRKTIWGPHSDGRWVRRGLLCSGVI